jgi:hypothetical protein
MACSSRSLSRPDPVKNLPKMIWSIGLQAGSRGQGRIAEGKEVNYAIAHIVTPITSISGKSISRNYTAAPPSASLNSLYSKLSASASQLASTTFSLTPTVPHTSAPSRDSTTTRTGAAVPAFAFTTRTL